MKIFTAGSKLFRGRVLKVPKFVLHPAIEFFRILFPFHVEFYTDRRVHAHREVIVDDIVRYTVLIWSHLIFLIKHFYLPAVHHYRCRFLYFLEIISYSNFKSINLVLTIRIRMIFYHDIYIL